MATTTKSLSPFDIKGKGLTKIFSFLNKHSAVHTPPEYLLKSLNELPLCICQGVPICSCYMLKALLFLNCAVHAPPDCRKDLQKMLFKKNQELYIMKEIETYCSNIQTSIHDLLLYFLHNANNA